MRTLAIALLGCLGCGHEDRANPIMVDATPPLDVPPPDPEMFCDAPGSANITVIAGVAATLAFMHAGVNYAGVSGADDGIVLLFTSADHVPLQTANCCAEQETGCCTLDGLAVSFTDGIVGSGDQRGDHAISIRSLSDPMFKAQGTATLTNFVIPESPLTGRISGSISTPGGSIAGTFDNGFCPGMGLATL